MIDRLAGLAVMAFARVVTGVRAEWRGCTPDPRPRVYFANHNSHGDGVLLWTVLPETIRRRTRPVAAADYWTASPLRRFVGTRVFHSLLIDRGSARGDPIGRMAAALDEGASLVIFPEGTRNTGEERLLPFKGGLFNLARDRPEVELVPVWIANLHRVMPKGEYVPVPLLCTVTFGTPQHRFEGEEKALFLSRMRDALLSLAPEPPK